MLVNNYKGNFEFSSVIGLSSSNQYKNIFDLAYEQGQIASPNYAFHLGSTYRGDNSYFYYNISGDDFANVTYSKLVNNDHWTLECISLNVYNSSFKCDQFIVDTGSTTTRLLPKLYKQLFGAVFKQYCQPSNTGFLACKCDLALYPNITLVLAGLEIVLTPQMYFFAQPYIPDCYLMFKETDAFNVLGVHVLRYYTVIFNKTGNSVGFTNTQKVTSNYFNSPESVHKFQVLQVCMVVCILVALFASYERKRIIPAVN